MLKNKLKVYVISSVRPEPTSAGQIILHRHLSNVPGLEYESYGFEPNQITTSSAIRRIMGRLAQTKAKRVAHDFWAWRNGRWLDALLQTSVPEPESSLVLTVAQGDAFGAACRFAHKHHLPLVTIFHDWWPDMASLHAPFRRILEQSFQNLYRQSQLALCVSEGMRLELGDHPNAQVLYPIPANHKQVQAPLKQGRNFKVLYFGNLHEYGPMLAEALSEIREHSLVRLETRGVNPNWPDSFCSEMAQEGMWHDFAPRAELERWIESADAFLVPMVFDPSMRRRMETSFPSKMVEMAQFGRPLVIWGPEYCSAVQWARRGDRALCVTDPDPKVLRRELEKLAASPPEVLRLLSAARDAARTEFSYERIQSQFMESLRNVVGN
jgi:glycosyltransferase involved in cell wall biosynthesis